MQRLRLKEIRASRIPESIGCCASDHNKLLSVVNEAQERLVLAGGEAGWWGSWARMVFNVDSALNPYVTLPRTVARVINFDICKTPVPIQNEFYEFLEAGVGLQPFTNCKGCHVLNVYDRGLVPTFVDLAPPNKKLRYYPTDPADANLRVLTQGTDQNGSTIYSLDGEVQVQGVFSSLAFPFVDTPMVIGGITGIQKDITTGPVRIFEVDTVTGNQRLLSTMDPSEQVAGYRRYFLGGVPRNCCNDGTTNIQVTGIAALEFIPVLADTDYCLIQNIPALKEECQSVIFGENDDSASLTQSAARHAKAVRILNGELTRRLGKDRVAVNFAPFGTAKLSHQSIGSLQ